MTRPGRWWTSGSSRTAWPRWRCMTRPGSRCPAWYRADGGPSTRHDRAMRGFSPAFPAEWLVADGLLDQGAAELPHEAGALAGVLEDLAERLGEQLDLGVADHQRRDQLDH